MFWLNVSIIAARVLIEAVFFAIGASIFSFLNVVIYRLPRHIGFVEGKSMCPSCKHTLEAKDLVPIIEVLGGVSAVICTLILGINIKALAAFLIVGAVTVVACILYDRASKSKGE